MRTLFTTLIAVSTGLFATVAHAVPTQLGHQGRLLDIDGLPMEGLHSLEFQLYDAVEDGTVLWSEAHDVELINGYYSLVLGADELGNPLEDDLFQDNDLYLELTVDEDERLEPRQPLNAVPYARIAGQATSVSGGIVDASEIRVDGATVVDSSGTWVSTTPTVDWSEITGIPTGFSDGVDDDTQLTEDEVDAFCADNGYALATDLDGYATVASLDDYAMASDLDEYATVSSLDEYATVSSLDEYATVSSLDEYATVSSLDDYAMASDLDEFATVDDLSTAAASISYSDLVDVPASLSGGGVGTNVAYFTDDDSFTVPEGISTLIVYVTGGGGGGANGETTTIDSGHHSHDVDSHSHTGGASHTHSAGSHTHTGDSHSHSETGYGCTTSHFGTSCGGVSTTTGGATITLTEGTGSSGEAAIGTTNGAALTTNEASVSGGSITTKGGDGGAGGGMNALLIVDAGTVCEVGIGTGGAAGGEGTGTILTCGDVSVNCAGGANGLQDGGFGRDGRCTVTGGSTLSEYKASHGAPGGGGAGGHTDDAGSGESGSITIRY